MSLTKNQLKQLIKEELEATIAQEGIFDMFGGGKKGAEKSKEDIELGQALYDLDSASSIGMKVPNDRELAQMRVDDPNAYADLKRVIGGQMSKRYANHQNQLVKQVYDTKARQARQDPASMAQRGKMAADVEAGEKAATDRAASAEVRAGLEASAAAEAEKEERRRQYHAGTLPGQRGDAIRRGRSIEENKMDYTKDHKNRVNSLLMEKWGYGKKKMQENEPPFGECPEGMLMSDETGKCVETYLHDQPINEDISALADPQMMELASTIGPALVDFAKLYALPVAIPSALTLALTLGASGKTASELWEEFREDGAKEFFNNYFLDANLPGAAAPADDALAGQKKRSFLPDIIDTLEEDETAVHGTLKGATPGGKEQPYTHTPGQSHSKQKIGDPKLAPKTPKIDQMIGGKTKPLEEELEEMQGHPGKCCDMAHPDEAHEDYMARITIRLAERGSDPSQPAPDPGSEGKPSDPLKSVAGALRKAKEDLASTIDKSPNTTTNGSSGVVDDKSVSISLDENDDKPTKKGDLKMRITKTQLRQIIKEELSSVLQMLEGDDDKIEPGDEPAPVDIDLEDVYKDIEAMGTKPELGDAGWTGDEIETFKKTGARPGERVGQPGSASGGPPAS